MSRAEAESVLSLNESLEFIDQDGRQIRLPALDGTHWGSRAFKKAHGLRFAYMAGAMAHGIASVELVKAMAAEGMLGSFGAAGLSLSRIESAIAELQSALADKAFAVNFIHTPSEPAVEEQLCDLLLQKNVTLVEASAFMRLTKALVRYRVTGLRRDADGQVLSKNRIIAKVSRPEVARHFWSPAPAALLDELLREGRITAEEHELAQKIPLAVDLTAEADSGGHTDNRPFVTLLPQMLNLKLEMEARFGYTEPLRVGAAGGIATPESVLAAFSMGAAYVVTGTINQACVEAGTSADVRKMLAETQQSDLTMAPAADMFEMGVKLQVLRRGTMFPMRAAKLYELYRTHTDLESLGDKDRQVLEDQFFRAPLASVWAETRAFFADRDPSQITLAEQNPRHKMALVFRSYLGQSSHWATRGQADRKLDYQVWCGPAMGAFNEWTKDSYLAAPEARRAGVVALNLLYLAAVLYRTRQLQFQGVDVSAFSHHQKPMAEADLRRRAEPLKGSFA